MTDAELRHEQDTLTRLIGKNREVAERLERDLQADQYQSQEAWQSFNIARKLIARQGGILLNCVKVANPAINRTARKSVQRRLLPHSPHYINTISYCS